MPPSVTFLDQQFVLQHHKRHDHLTIWEYLPDGQSFGDWTRLFAVRLAANRGLTVQRAAAKKIRYIKIRKENGDKVANYQAFRKEGRIVVDFLISSDKRGGFLEHNLFLYQKPAGRVLSYQFARRIYSKNATEDEIRTFIKAIPEKRTGLVRELTRRDLPRPDNL
jgi:hypothetical protein